MLDHVFQLEQKGFPKPVHLNLAANALGQHAVDTSEIELAQIRVER